MDEILAASKLKKQIVMFFGNFCGPCRMLKPVLTQLQGEEYDVSFIDVEKDVQIARQERIYSVPTVYVLDGGQKVGGFKGYISPGKINDILNQINNG